MKIAGFEFSENAHFQPGAERDPSAVGQHLELLRSRKQGELTPEDVLDDAQHDNSPLHSFFEWDDGEAARQYRLVQARGLIRAVVAVYTDDGAEPVRQRAYVNVRSGGGSPHYRETSEAMSEARTRDIVLQRAWRELQAWRQRYESLTEFAAVFRQVDTVAKKMPEKARH